MMTEQEPQRRRGGDRRSSWTAFRRRLFLVRRLVRSPADAATLIEEARNRFNHLISDDIYPGDARAALRADFRRLREEFECEIERQPDNRYAMTSLGQLALLDLPDDDLEALAFLVANFSESTLPNAARVDALIRRILALLPEDRRRLLDRGARDVRLDVPTPTNSLMDRTLEIVRRSIEQGQQLRFAYRSTYLEGEGIEMHRVAPYDLFFRDGHHYLEGYCYESPFPEIIHRYVTYRLDRMVTDSMQITHDRRPTLPPPRPHYNLSYVLSPTVARQRDIALWFPASVVTFREDGSAQVTATTSDLWQARQILLRYREHCRVLEPPELVEMMRESIVAMSEQYR
jgi:predicted DNA-binding transcriptional regulator YafY